MYTLPIIEIRACILGNFVDYYVLEQNITNKTRTITDSKV